MLIELVTLDGLKHEGTQLDVFMIVSEAFAITVEQAETGSELVSPAYARWLMSDSSAVT